MPEPTATGAGPEEARFIDHVSIGVTDLERSARFHDAILRDALGERYYAAFLRDPDGTKVEAVAARPAGYA